MAYDDALWAVLEKLRLANLFERHHIPPIVFPLAIVGILALLAFLLLAAPAPVSVKPCGNGSCDSGSGEDLLSCPEDCKIIEQGLRQVSVELKGEVKSSVKVRLDDQDLVTSGAMSGKKSQFEFTGLSAQSVIATVTNPSNGKSIPSGAIPLREQKTAIEIQLPSNFFDVSDIPPEKGSLKVVVRADGAPARAKVTPVLIKDSSKILLESQTIDSLGYFSVEANQFYAVIAEADGYTTYDSRDDPIMIGPNQEGTIEISLEATPPIPASLRVCSNAMGMITLSTITGVVISEQPLINGCAEFESTAGLVKLSLQPLGNCLPASKETLLEPGENNINLETTCGQAARARLKVSNEDDLILTQNATITAWYSNGEQIGTLSAASDGYTEFITVSPSESFYFTITAPGYTTQNTPEYELLPNENRSIDFVLQPSSESLYDFAFNGVAYPSQVKTNSSFSVSVSSIHYGSTDVTDFANLSVAIAGKPCAVAKARAWTAVCTAPAQPGEYDIAFIANYDGAVGTHTGQIIALTTGSGQYFTLTPYGLTDTAPPISMNFDIKFNNTPLDSLTDSIVTVYYGDYLVASGLKLTGSNGLYSLNIDTPFPGNHRAEIKLVKTRGAVYEQDFTLTFLSEPSSLMLTAQTQVSPKIVSPGQAFSVYATLKRGALEVANLTNVYATISGVRTRLLWDSNNHAYIYSFTAPPYEGIYPISFELEYQDLPEKKVYVVDTTKTRSSDCPIAACTNVLEVRQCVYKHRNENFYSEAETISCIEDGLFSGADISHCLAADANRGDWAKDCSLTQEDIPLMSDFLTSFVAQEERNMYAGCGDMDNDGDVDDTDKTCLTNVVATKWYGDVGDLTCSRPMRGAFCMDIESDLPGDFNGDSQIDSTDLGIMGSIVRSASAGVTPPETLLDLADFEQNDAITNSDMTCLQGITGSGPISTACLAVYGFGCEGTPGDLTTDGSLDRTDLLIESWIVGGRLEYETVFECVDVNDDGLLTQDDYSCLQATVDSDYLAMESFCNPCWLELQRLGRYGDEICHDGLDNDCDNAIDEDCACNQQQSCSRLYDIDGIPDTNDFKLCRAFSSRREGSSGWYSSTGSTGTWEEPHDYGWYTLSQIWDSCGQPEEWGNTMSCGGATATCLYKYHAGFSMRPGTTELYVFAQLYNEQATEDMSLWDSIVLALDLLGSDEYQEGLTDAAKFYFEWLIAEGNVGPAGVAYNCSQLATARCPSDWHQVAQLPKGEVCDASSGNSSYCVVCRYDYDICTSKTCESSGGSIPASCNNTYPAAYTEVCPAKHVCLGMINEEEPGIGMYDPRYGSELNWIPISDMAGGRLRVYVSGPVSRVYLTKDPIAHFGILDEGTSIGDGNYAFSKVGIDYGACYVIAEFADGSSKVYHIPTGAGKYALSVGTLRF